MDVVEERVLVLALYVATAEKKGVESTLEDVAYKAISFGVFIGFLQYVDIQHLDVASLLRHNGGAQADRLFSMVNALPHTNHYHDILRERTSLRVMRDGETLEVEAVVMLRVALFVMYYLGDGSADDNPELILSYPRVKDCIRLGLGRYREAIRDKKQRQALLKLIKREFHIKISFDDALQLHEDGNHDGDGDGDGDGNHHRRCAKCLTPRVQAYDYFSRQFFCSDKCRELHYPDMEAPFSAIDDEDRAIPLLHTGSMEAELQRSRRALDIQYTDEHMQLAYESVKPGGILRREIHPTQSQFIQIKQGEAEVLIYYPEGESDQLYRSIRLAANTPSTDDYIIIHASTYHEVRNTGVETLQFLTIYAPNVH